MDLDQLMALYTDIQDRIGDMDGLNQPYVEGWDDGLRAALHVVQERIDDL